MMGGYCYYDANFNDDLPSELHDCMWSGECYSCQPGRVTFSAGSVMPISTGTSLPLNANSGGYITLTSTNASFSEPTKRPFWPQETIKQISPSDIEMSCSDSNSTTLEDLVEEDKSIALESPSPKRDNRIKSALSPAMTESQRSNFRGNSTTTSQANGNRRQNNLTKHSQHNVSPSENKKLRHREVEKNRHRQLQAMVKTLSEKIPGKVDKETQVQTMKRAARYCVYLREVLNFISNGQEHSNLKEKLESIYTTSCENVEMIMSQSGSK